MNIKQYEKIWLDKVIDANKQFAHYNLMDDVIPKNDQLLSSFKTGGTRVRKHPMIGTYTSTYAPSVNAVPELVAETTTVSAGSKKGNKTAKAVNDFGTGFKQGFVAPFKLVGDAATAMSPVLPYVAMMGAGKGDELEKAKESLNKFMNNERKTKPSKKH